MTGDTIHMDFGNTNRDLIDETPIPEFEDERVHINIVNPDHPLAGGFTGQVRVYEDPYPVNWAFIETMGPGVDVIATADEAGEYATLFAYEKGAELEDGTASAGLRIGFWLGQGSGSNVLFGAPSFDNLHPNGLKRVETAINYALGILDTGPPELMAGDANQDLKFDQLDLVQVQIAAKYLTGQPATWGEGDWNGAPGGEQGSPPAGDGVFNQVDIIAALGPSHYLTGPYAALAGDGSRGDEQTSIVYNPTTGEIAVDAPASTELTSINIDSAASIFTGEAALNLGGSFDNDADNNIFKATFGSSFGSLSFGNVAQTGLSKDFVLNDLTVIGSLAGGGDLGNVDLIYVPEPSALMLVLIGAIAGAGLIQPVRFRSV